MDYYLLYTGMLWAIHQMAQAQTLEYMSSQTRLGLLATIVKQSIRETLIPTVARELPGNQHKLRSVDLVEGLRRILMCLSTVD